MNWKIKTVIACDPSTGHPPADSDAFRFVGIPRHKDENRLGRRKRMSMFKRDVEIARQQVQRIFYGSHPFYLLPENAELAIQALGPRP
jgi:hypothetical protein